MDKNSLRPVLIKFRGENLKGFFHRYVYQNHEYYSTTRALIELDNGRLKYFDPEFVQFMDRSNNKSGEQ